jgi:hypothetical protein
VDMESVESMMGGLPAFVVAKSTGGKQIGEDEDKATILLHHPAIIFY